MRRTLSVLLTIAAANVSVGYAQSSAESERVVKPMKIVKTNLGSDINSAYSELAPIISSDGKLLFFTMGSGNPDNIGSDHLQDCYVSRNLGENHWSQPRNLGAPINSTGNDAISGVSPDASLLFIRNFGFNRTNGLCFARYSGPRIGWEIAPITIDHYSNSGGLASQCISPDWKSIIFSAKRDDGHGGADLYVSRLVDRSTNRYGTPINLGSVINSTEDEFAPFLATDGKTLYFSSKGHPGFGDADVFVSKRLDDTWTNWSTPKNLGAELNTKGMDAYYSVPASGDIAYFSSSNGGNHMDIYSVTLAEDIRPNPVILVSGRVIDESNHPIVATVTYRHLMTDSISTVATTNRETGRFALVVPFGEDYAYRVEAPGYLPYMDNLDLTNTRPFSELKVTITLDSITNGSAVTLRNIFFDFDKSTLRPESHFELDRLAAMLRANPSWSVAIEGHTDSLGTEAHNLELSKERADAVVHYLLEKGIEESRVSSEGFGSSQPLAPNGSEEGRSMNRRVVFRIRSIAP